MLSAVAMTASRVSRWIAGRRRALLSAPLRVGRRRCETLRAPCSGLAYAQVNERTVRTKDSTRERHGLFRCGAFGAACVAVHRSNIREWHPPGPNFIQHSGRLFGSAICEPDPHCLTLCDPFATYRRVNHSPASTICGCIPGCKVGCSGPTVHRSRRQVHLHLAEF